MLFQEVAEFIPLIMTTITLQPTPAQRTHKDFNKEVFADFVHAQASLDGIEHDRTKRFIGIVRDESSTR